MAKNKYQLEYVINTSERILFNRVSTASGLTEWFADDVNVNDNIYTFIWNGVEQDAKILAKKDLSYIKFHWVEDEEEDTFFEFRLNKLELTGGLALLVTDFAEEDEKEDAISLWDTQISELKHILGL
ncbi:MAG: SRPBCC domain-containing protein [Bacteroidetes bacterium]|nr:MAG: SRPBCC domain-containing protein [Bacteroidota bacterium]